MMTTLGKQNIGIVGFSYEVTNSTSAKPWITKREFGRKTDWKVEVAHGRNWSEEYSNWFAPHGYGHSHIYLANEGPFYSIVGGYTDYTSHDSTAASVKSDEWGVETGDKFCLREGYAWNRFLNQEGYSRTYIYLIQKAGINNFWGSRIQSTSKDSTCPWIETNFFGERTGKEINLTGSYGWSQQYGDGYNHFSLYVDEALRLDNHDTLWGKINEIERERDCQQARPQAIAAVNDYWAANPLNQDQATVLGGVDWPNTFQNLTSVEDINRHRDHLKGLITATKEAEKRRAEEELTKAQEAAKIASDAKAKAEDDLKNIRIELDREKNKNKFLVKTLEEQASDAKILEPEQHAQIQMPPKE